MHSQKYVFFLSPGPLLCYISYFSLLHQLFFIIQSTSTHFSKSGGATDVQCLDILMM